MSDYATIRRKAPAKSASPTHSSRDSASASAVTAQPMHNISNMRVRSQRSDAAELEAESTADSVVRGGGPVSVSQTPAAAISCWSAGYNDVKDDFWGTKETYGKQTGSAIDSAMNTAWDAIGLIPEVGSAASTLVDVGKAGYSGLMGTVMGWDAELTGNTAERMRASQYNDAASSFMGDAGVDMTGLIPYYGSLESAAALGWDGARTVDIATGANPDTVPPSATDGQKQIASGIWDWATGP